MPHSQGVTYMQIIRLKNSQKCCRNFAPAARDRDGLRDCKAIFDNETIRNLIVRVFTLCRRCLFRLVGHTQGLKVDFTYSTRAEKSCGYL